jgi:hypothetical protein
MTQRLLLMGEMMGTSFVTGTKSKGTLSGIGCWFAGLSACVPGLKVSNDDLVVSHYNAHDDYSPVLTDMAESAVSGSLILADIGWYKNSGSSGSQSFYFRDGGHMVSMNYAWLDSAGKFIGFRDPADDKLDLHTQSPFIPAKYATQDENAWFGVSPRKQTRIIGYPTNATPFLDGYVALRPMFTASAESDIVSITKISLSDADSTSPQEYTFSVGTGKNIIDLAVHPESSRHPYLVQGEDVVWQIDELRRTAVRFAAVSHPRRLVFGGPHEELHVLGGQQITTLARDGTTKARVQLSTPVDAITYDPAHERLIAISSRLGRLNSYSPTLEARESIAIPPVFCGEDVIARVQPDGAAVWILCPGDITLTRVDISGIAAGVLPEATRVTLSTAIRPVTMSIGDTDYLYVSDSGVLHVYDPSGKLVERSAFNGRKAGKVLDVLRSFDNFDPATMSGPEYNNVLPEDAGR